MWRLLTALFFVCCLSACEQGATLPSPFKAQDVSYQFKQAPQFELVDQQGQTRSLEEFKDQVVLVFFGYTHCPDICPTTLADLDQVIQQSGDAGDKIQVLFITVDPERDQPARLADYMSGFNDDFLALTGSQEQIRHVADQFNIEYSRQPLERGYYIEHTTGTYLIDPAGRIRLYAPYQQHTRDFVQDIQLLLQGV